MRRIILLALLIATIIGIFYAPAMAFDPKDTPPAKEKGTERNLVIA